MPNGSRSSDSKTALGTVRKSFQAEERDRVVLLDPYMGMRPMRGHRIPSFLLVGRVREDLLEDPRNRAHINAKRGTPFPPPVQVAYGSPVWLSGRKPV